MTAPDPVELLRQVRRSAPGRDPTPDCLNDDTIAALSEGGATVPPERRTAALAHLASCAGCRAVLASLVRARRDPQVAREIAAAEGIIRPWFTRIAITAAAAAAILIAVVSWPVDRGGSTHRAPTITAAAAPVLLAPLSAVPEAGSFRWSALAGADRYRFTLSDASGALIYQVQLADTAVALPGGVTLTPGRPYLWMVEARTGWNRWVPSRLAAFTITAGTGSRPR